MMNVATIEKTPPDKSEPPPVWWNFNQPRASDADRATVSHATAVQQPSSVTRPPCNHLSPKPNFRHHVTAVQPGAT